MRGSDTALGRQLLWRRMRLRRDRPLEEYDAVICLGRKVEAALRKSLGARARLTYVPHPSGRNRAWNDARQFRRVARQLREVMRGD